ncbi:hydrolase [Actinotalea ferrariae CF5-4]|uniref:Hydrolase n=1 Tax=Actinotalea ferrariae CF5-4 TaxID=948458 RepID=A0A021VSB3_9CELL|nr:alpha/beta fold hydrolase [Actinotalea ferrariae]EYR64094.1 hydrolase [Actinotalea ferrariae CF5-4]
MAVTGSVLSTPRLAVAARSAGEGELLLFLHGITAGAAVWDPVLEDLGREYRCVAVDQRGHGRSDRPAHGYTAEDYVADVAAVLDVLGPARAVVGHSLGARNAILAGSALPERIGAVVAIDYAAGIEPEVFERLRQSRSGGEGPLPDEDAVRRAVLARSPRLPPDAVERRVRHLYEAVDGGFVPRAAPWAVDQTLAAMDVDLTGALRGTTVPTLLVRGAESPFLSEAAFATSLALRPDLGADPRDDLRSDLRSDLRADVRGAVVAGTDHFVPEEAPGEVAALVRGLLRG